MEESGKRALWTKLVADFELSGQSQRAFAEARQVELSNLRYWIRRGIQVAGFDILQMVFVDRPTDCAIAIGCRGDRLFQVHVGIPVEAELDYRSAAAFVAIVA